MARAKGDTAESVRERERKALALSLSGVTNAEIARRLGYAGAQSSWRVVKRALDRLGSAEYSLAERSRQRTRVAAGLDALLAAWWQRAREDPGALTRALKILDMKSRLFGLYVQPDEGASLPDSIEIEFVSGEAPVVVEGRSEPVAEEPAG